MQLFAYLAALLTYVCIAGLGLVFCLALALSPSHRQSAKQIAGGVIGSFPGVFLFQAVSAPLVAVAVLLFLGMHQVTGELSGASQAIVVVLALLSTLGLFAAASVARFLVGWGVGYRVASGMPFKVPLRASRILDYPLRIADRLTRKNAV
jgi:hypothetical protein